MIDISLFNSLLKLLILVLIFLSFCALYYPSKFVLSFLKFKNVDVFFLNNNSINEFNKITKIFTVNRIDPGLSVSIENIAQGEKLRKMADEQGKLACA